MHLAEVRRRLYSSVKKAREEALHPANTIIRLRPHVGPLTVIHSEQSSAVLYSLQRRRNPQSRARGARAFLHSEESGKQ